MTEKTFFQLRQSAQEKGIPAAAKLRKADLKQRLVDALATRPPRQICVIQLKV